MWYQDLSPCDYFPLAAGLLAIGWLERTKPFATGKVDRAVYDRLLEFSKDPWEPICAGGSHGCDLCLYTPGARCSANLFIPYQGAIYVCPQLIVHYMNAHTYAPPAIFCEAVLACPPMKTAPYFRAIKDGGGQALLSM